MRAEAGTGGDRIQVAFNDGRDGAEAEAAGELLAALTAAREWMCPPVASEDYRDEEFTEAIELVAQALRRRKEHKRWQSKPIVIQLKRD